MRLDACSTAAPNPCGSVGGSTPNRLAAERWPPKRPGSRRPCPLLPKGSLPFCNSTEVEEHRGREMGAPSSPGRNSERDPGTSTEKLPSRGGLTEVGLHRTVDRHQDCRVGASEVLRTRRAVPCGAGCRAGSCEPAAEARLPDYRSTRKSISSARDHDARGRRVRIPWRTRPAQ